MVDRFRLFPREYNYGFQLYQVIALLILLLCQAPGFSANKPEASDTRGKKKAVETETKVKSEKINKASMNESSKDSSRRGSFFTLSEQNEHQSLPQWLSGLNEPKTLNQDSDDTLDNDMRSPLRISRIINSHNEEIQDYYHNFLKLNPDLAGKLIVRIFVNTQGHIEKVEVVETDIPDSKFIASIIGCIRNWGDFDQCGGGKTKIYRQQYHFGE